MKDTENSGQISLFDQDIDFLAEISAREGWPDPEDFPYNKRNTSVGTIVEEDLRSSSNPLIVTGYASLDKRIKFSSEIGSNFESIRILLGCEPYESQRKIGVREQYSLILGIIGL